VSLEDIIRELLGKLSDEHQPGSDSTPARLPDGRWRMTGRLPLDEALAWAQSQGTDPWEPSTAETLAGWLLERLDTIPDGSCCLQAGGLCFEIERMDGTAIESVLAWIPGTYPGGRDA